VFDIFAGKDPQKALQRAHELIKEGKVPQAIKVLNDNLTQGEESFDLYLELARLYFETDQRAEAVEALRNVQTLVPSRSDEVIALLSDYFYRHASIDAGDFLIQLYTQQSQYEEIAKVLRSFQEREIKLLVNKYEKLRQQLTGKKVISKKDLENIIILCTIYFLTRDPKIATEIIESMLDLEGFQKEILAWARVIARERFNDPYAALLLLKLLIRNGQYDEALVQAQRAYEKFPDFLDPLIDILSQAHPPKELESDFSEFLTGLYVKKGDLDASLARLQIVLRNDPAKIDEVIKTLRELQRINPKNLKVLYTLGDTLLNSGRISLAITEYDKIMEIAPEEAEKITERYKRAFEKEPNNPLVIQGLVNFYLKQNRFDEAVDVIQRAYNIDRGLLDEYLLNLNAILEKNPDNLDALKLLGLCYAHKGENENAIVIIENLLESGRYDMVEQMLDDITKARPKEYQYLNLRALSLTKTGEIERAYSLIINNLDDELNKVLIFIPTLDKIINHRPDLAPKIIEFYQKHQSEEPVVFDIALARAYAYCGEYEKSIKKFDEYLSKPEYKDTAKRALVEVIKERPKAIPLLLSAARAFMKDGEIEIATQFFKTAQIVDPKAFFEIIDEFYDTLKNFPKDREVRVMLIDTFFDRKVYDRVIEEAKKAIEVFGQEAQYFNLRLGQALVEKGNLSDGVRPLMLALDGTEDYSKEVLEYLNKILAIDKSNIPAHFARGRALARARRIDEAVEEYILTARIVPARAEYVLEELKNLLSRAIANPNVLYAIGSVEISLKRYEEGIKHIVSSCELDSNLVGRAIPIFEKLLKEVPSPSLEFALGRLYSIANLKDSAVRYYISAQSRDKKYLEQAISEMKKICMEDPENIGARKGLAQIYFNYNNLEDALNLTDEIYRSYPQEAAWAKSFVFEILSKNPNHLPSYYFLGKVFLQEKNFAKALDVFKKLLEIFPSEVPEVIKILNLYQEQDFEVAFYLAKLYKEGAKISDALELFRNLFNKNVTYADAIIEQLGEILGKNSNLPEAHILLSDIFIFKGEYDLAIDSLTKAERLVPERWEEVALKKGQAYFKKGEIEKAIEIYNTLLGKTLDRKRVYKIIKETKEKYLKEQLEKIKGEDVQQRLARARVYLLLGQISDVEKELDFEPQDTATKKQCLLLKAEVCLKENRPLDALEVIRNLPVDIETAPVYADIYEAIGSYEAAASVLRMIDRKEWNERILKYEKLAQEKRLGKARYFIEGRI